jgi:periplasmic divalent cation tolerance protein
MNACIVYITTRSADEAKTIARALVEERLAGSVNLIDGARSVYRWRGEVLEADETLMFAKTRLALVGMLVERVRELHTHEVPCIVAIAVDAGHAGYLDWIDAETIEHEVGG